MEAQRRKHILKILRERHGVSVAELATEINVRKSCIYNYECFYRKPNDEIAYRLLDFFRIKGEILMLEQLRPEKMK